MRSTFELAVFAQARSDRHLNDPKFHTSTKEPLHIETVLLCFPCLKVFGGAASFRCRSRDLVLIGVQRYAREPKRG